MFYEEQRGGRWVYLDNFHESSEVELVDRRIMSQILSRIFGNENPTDLRVESQVVNVRHKCRNFFL